MQTTTLLLVFAAALAALALVFFQYYFKAKRKGKLAFLLSVLRFFAYRQKHRLHKGTNLARYLDAFLEQANQWPEPMATGPQSWPERGNRFSIAKE